MSAKLPCRQLTLIRDTEGRELGGECVIGRSFPADCTCAAYDPVPPDEERTPCEIWTRVMGYHRPVANFNAGKRAEHEERCYFKESAHGH